MNEYEMLECLHESWTCNGGWHKCADCRFNWDGLNLRADSFTQAGQIGKCNLCPKVKDAVGITDSVYVTKDSGERESFGSGAVRDTQTDKPRYDLIPPKGLKRVAEVYTRGASKYDDHNWRKGMPSSRIMASLLRHVEAYRAGERDEDHIGQAIFNALALIEFEGTEWDDLSTMWTGDNAPE